MTDEHHMNLLFSWDDDPFALLERNFPEEYAPYRMAIRIAELEATVARLTAPPTPDEAVAFTHDRLFTTAGGGGNMGALTAFLERRMKG